MCQEIPGALPAGAIVAAFCALPAKAFHGGGYAALIGSANARRLDFKGVARHLVDGDMFTASIGRGTRHSVVSKARVFPLAGSDERKAIRGVFSHRCDIVDTADIYLGRKGKRLRATVAFVIGGLRMPLPVPKFAQVPAAAMGML